MRAALPRVGAIAPTTRARWNDAIVAVLGLACLLTWDALPLDLPLSRLFGDADGFALREHWITQGVLHDGGRLVGFALLGLLVANVKWPLWPGLSRAERLLWLATTLACLVLVPMLKRYSPTSCPWDLQLFGGPPQALYLSHWHWRSSDLGPGGCFPSGHAVSAFAFLSGWFALRERHPDAARRWLSAVLAMGLLFGGAQLARGAHFASHTLWSAWLCWVICALSPLSRSIRR